MNDELIQQAIRLRVEGLSYSKIATQLGSTYAAIRYNLDEKFREGRKARSRATHQRRAASVQNSTPIDPDERKRKKLEYNKAYNATRRRLAAEEAVMSTAAGFATVGRLFLAFTELSPERELPEIQYRPPHPGAGSLCDEDDDAPCTTAPRRRRTDAEALKLEYAKELYDRRLDRGWNKRHGKDAPTDSYELYSLGPRMVAANRAARLKNEDGD